METTQQYVVRTQSDRSYTFGLGEVVVPGVTLFRDGNYDLSREEVDAKLLRLTTTKKAH